MVITSTIFQMRKPRLRMVKPLVKLAQLEVGAELGFKPRFVRLQGFSLPTIRPWFIKLMTLLGS